MNNIEVSNELLLSMLYGRGYRISIVIRNNSKFVTFHSTLSKPYEQVACYSTEFTDHQIRLDVVNKLLSWSGLRVVASLE